MVRPITELSLYEELRKEQQSMIDRPRALERGVRRARIVLKRAEGLSQPQTAEAVGVNRPVVVKWKKRLRQGGIAEAKRLRRKPSVRMSARTQIITENKQAPAGRTRWSSRSMAKAKGVSANTGHRLWRANHLKAHTTRTFQLSRDKHFEVGKAP